MTYPNLYHLKYFRDAVELGSISAAARKNLVSHPAISQAIKSIETNLNIQLLIHKRRVFEVTPEGLALALKTNELFLAINYLTEKSPTPDGQIEGNLILGMSRSLAHSYLSLILSRIKNEYPKVQIEVKFGTTGELIERSAQDRVDISLTIGHHPMPTLKQKLLRRGKFVLIEAIAKSKETSRNFILTEPKYETELLKKVYFKKFRKPLESHFEVGSWDSIAQLVEEGHGCGLVPDICITSARRMFIKKISAPWFNCSYDIYLNESKSIQKRAARGALSDLICEIFQDSF